MTSLSIRNENGASKSCWAVSLNLGLENNPLADLPLAQHLAVLRWAFSRGDATKPRPGTSALVVRVMGTEKTLAYRITLNASAPGDAVNADIVRALDWLANTYGQEAIAWRASCVQSQSSEQENATLCGLVGPKAEDWGPFNPEYFVAPDAPESGEGLGTDWAMDLPGAGWTR